MKSFREFINEAKNPIAKKIERAVRKAFEGFKVVPVHNNFKEFDIIHPSEIGATTVKVIVNDADTKIKLQPVLSLSSEPKIYEPFVGKIISL